MTPLPPGPEAVLRAERFQTALYWVSLIGLVAGVLVATLAPLWAPVVWMTHHWMVTPTLAGVAAGGVGWGLFGLDAVKNTASSLLRALLWPSLVLAAITWFILWCCSYTVAPALLLIGAVGSAVLFALAASIGSLWIYTHPLPPAPRAVPEDKTPKTQDIPTGSKQHVVPREPPPKNVSVAPSAAPTPTPTA